jgi:16S rRNA (guanine(527)-N(7))-methyltransferase RsmG
MIVNNSYLPWFSENKIPFPNESALRQLSQFTELISQWNKAINITAAQSKEEVVQRHILDSLTASDFCKEEKNILDIGSGGGFPAIPLAIVLPLTNFVLVERVPKKCAFLNRVKRKLGLTNITVINCDLEKLNLDFKVCTAITRAVRVDEQFIQTLLSKGFVNLITFTSKKATSEKYLKYKLVLENFYRFVNLNKINKVTN